MFKTVEFSDLAEFQGFPNIVLIFKKTYKIIRSSDEKILYMKVAQNDETILDTQPVHPPHTPNLSNSQLSPSVSSARKRETPGILSRMFPPFTGITSYCVRSSLAPRIAMLCFVML